MSSPLLHQATNDAEGIVERAVGLLEDSRVSTVDQDRAGLAGVLDSSDLDDLGSVLADLFNELSRSKPVLSESLNVGDGGATNTLLQSKEEN